ncbi:SRPBCC domain-containing protein [Caulobacter sp. Root1472]|uniref:SRPBCC domain-containing protein n=1 Tax=Caulobacter sp. Root1472 TaxID=1736470 RepID=UPI0007016B86|nr:SRPBCC domain-containing protein [Caulobacter sp. Root1472]KQZ25776.1 ATPase [Caulobacter sp. Root1472]
MSSKVLVALRIKAAPSRVFEAFTADIGAWWRPNALFSFTPRSPGVLAFEGIGQGARLVERLPSGKVFEIGAVRIWNPGERLVFGWRQASFAPGMETEVEVRFEPAGDETRVTVEHRGWDTVPTEHVARHRFPDAVFLQRHAEWWRALLTSLASRAAMDVKERAREGDA